jgi:hypothetical protein
MAKQLEKYAAGLEELVMARTADLENEKRKSEELLYRELHRRLHFFFFFFFSPWDGPRLQSRRKVIDIFACNQRYPGMLPRAVADDLKTGKTIVPEACKWKQLGADPFLMRALVFLQGVWAN